MEGYFECKLVKDLGIFESLIQATCIDCSDRHRRCDSDLKLLDPKYGRKQCILCKVYKCRAFMTLSYKPEYTTALYQKFIQVKQNGSLDKDWSVVLKPELFHYKIYEFSNRF